MGRTPSTPGRVRHVEGPLLIQLADAGDTASPVTS